MDLMFQFGVIGGKNQKTGKSSRILGKAQVFLGAIM
jgi:hypothetical protein